MSKLLEWFLLFLTTMASSHAEKLGVHALFGAFMAGLVMPKNERLLTDVVERIESLSLALLLPLFFALTGLRTRIDLMGRSALGYGLAILAVAVAGKLPGRLLPRRPQACSGGTPLAWGF
jgi:Kef-type K+ transport system membrane component KefB